jgi:hypothetical protein
LKGHPGGCDAYARRFADLAGRPGCRQYPERRAQIFLNGSEIH